jgi:septum formation protein
MTGAASGVCNPIRQIGGVLGSTAIGVLLQARLTRLINRAACGEPSPRTLPAVRLVLGSQSPARLAVLRAAGVDPLVLVSGVDEDAVAASLTAPTPTELVTALATAKAEAVVAALAGREPDAVVIGCDSMLNMPVGNGTEMVGKPASVDVARQRWAHMAGHQGALLTGHAVLRLRDGVVDRRSAGVGSTTVRFGRPTDHELDAYLDTGEPLAVAGAFTLDGLGGWFVDGIDGDPSSVIGISLPLTRGLLAEVGVSVVDLWHRTSPTPHQT